MTNILPYLAAITLWLSLITYAVLGGADFGGGVLQLTTLSKQSKDERELILNAVKPVWEADNVWLIYLIVGLYVTFPRVSQVLATALFIPLSLVLVGVVMRGAAFAFRTHITQEFSLRAIWGTTFSVASLLAPFFLGVTAGAVASGQLRVLHNNVPVALVQVWLTPFALIIGATAVFVCATLAAIYLTVEAQMRENERLMNAFRARAFATGGIAAILGVVALLLAPSQASPLWRGMLDHALWAVIITVLIGIGTAAALFFRRYRLARMLIALDTGAFLGTWGLAQLPYIIPPDLTISGTASPSTTLWEFLVSAAVGMLVLIPSLWFLFRVFKSENPTPPVHEKEVESS